MLRLALPVLAEQLLIMLVVYSDALLTGHYFGEPELAAINLLNYVLWMTSSLWLLISIGSTALVARFVGAGDWDLARRVTNQSFVAGVVLAVVSTAAGMFFCDEAVRLLQLEDAAAERATLYLRIFLPVLPASMIEVIGIACLRGAGDTISGLIVMIAVNVVNIAISWPLALGWFGAPELGWSGLAIGTASGHLVGGLMMLIMLLRGRSGLRLTWHSLLPELPVVRRICRIGIPGGADMLTVNGLQLWFVAIVNQLGDLAAAAHGIAIRIESLGYLPGIAFQVAATTLVGQYLGAGDHRRASRSVVMALLVGGGTITSAGFFFFTFSEQLVELFVNSQQSDVVETAAPLLRIVALGMPALAINMMLIGALRGAGDTLWPLLFTLVGYLGVRIPLAYLFAHTWGWGVSGAWYAMLADLYIRSLLIGYRFLHGGWKRINV